MRNMYIPFPLQQWLHIRVSMLRYTYIACLITALHKSMGTPLLVVVTPCSCEACQVCPFFTKSNLAQRPRCTLISKLQETLRVVWLSTPELCYTVAVLYDASIALLTCSVRERCTNIHYRA
jgi:hypothetical protein